MRNPVTPRLPRPPRHLSRMAPLALAAVLAVATLVLPGLASAHGGTPEQNLAAVSFDQKLGAKVPLDLVFRDEAGQATSLRSYFGTKPVVLVFDYYNCPNLCPLSLDSLSKTLEGFSLGLGDDFSVLTVSIDPKDTAALAATMKAEFAPGGSGAAAASDPKRGWHFLTGDEPSIEQLTQTVGFHYVYDADQQEYAHPTGVIVLTPAGVVSRYLYGLDYPQRDLRLALVEASSSQIGSPVDQLLLTCYHYNPTTGRYSGIAFGVVQAGGTLTAVVLGGFVFTLFWRGRSRRRRAGARKEQE